MLSSDIAKKPFFQQEFVCSNNLCFVFSEVLQHSCFHKTQNQFKMLVCSPVIFFRKTWRQRGEHTGCLGFFIVPFSAATVHAPQHFNFPTLSAVKSKWQSVSPSKLQSPKLMIQVDNGNNCRIAVHNAHNCPKIHSRASFMGPHTWLWSFHCGNPQSWQFW